MRPILMNQTAHTFEFVETKPNHDRYLCKVCQIEGKRFGVSEVIHVADDAQSKCEPNQQEEPMAKKDAELSLVPEQTEPVQTTAFEKDELDPQIAKIADRVVDLLVQKKTTDDSLTIQKKNLIGMLHKAKKTAIMHRGMQIKVKMVAEKEELTIKQLKPVDGQKSKAKRVK